MKSALHRRPTTNNALQQKNITKSASNDHDNDYLRSTIRISFQIPRAPANRWAQADLD